MNDTKLETLEGKIATLNAESSRYGQERTGLRGEISECETALELATKADDAEALHAATGKLTALRDLLHQNALAGRQRQHEILEARRAIGETYNEVFQVDGFIEREQRILDSNVFEDARRKAQQELARLDGAEKSHVDALASLLERRERLAPPDVEVTRPGPALPRRKG